MDSKRKEIEEGLKIGLRQIPRRDLLRLFAYIKTGQPMIVGSSAITQIQDNGKTIG